MYLQDAVQFPITAQILGRPMQIIGFDNDNSRVLAVLKEGSELSKIDLRDLSVAERSEGARAVKAYVAWRGGW